MTSLVKTSLDFPPILITPLRFPIIPGSDDGVNRPMVMMDPFVDPADTFRAQTIADTFFITPDRGLFDSFEFDVGLPPDIGPFIFSIQNRTVNAVLRVNLTLPSYLRSNLGTEFDVPFIGDTDTVPIQFPTTIEGGPPPPLDFLSSGTGLINVSLTFNEPQAKTFNPGRIIDELIFDIFHRDELTGPVFVSTTIQQPEDLNSVVRREAELSGITALQVRVPLDSGDLDAQAPVESTITTLIDVPEFTSPIPEPFWIDGTDGKLKSGSPPAGWTTEADGRAYPPIDQPVSSVVESRDVEGVIDTESLSPIEQLFVEANRTVAPAFGSETSRKGFVIDVVPLLTGIQINRIVRQVPQLLIADSVPSDTRFEIVNWSDTFPDGNPVPNPEIDSRTREYFDQVNFHVGLIKQDELVPISFATALQSATSNAIRRVLQTGDPVIVRDESSEAQQQNLRIIVTAAAILKQLITIGGIALTDLSTQVIQRS